MNHAVRFFVLLLVSACIAVPAAARSTYPSHIPNGTAADESHGGCITCHQSALGGDGRNAFGVDVGASLASGLPDWQSVCDVDSDGDGDTNGAELGDPDCTWTRGSTPARTTGISRPGDSASTVDNPEGSAPAAGNGDDVDLRSGCHAAPSGAVGVLALLLLRVRPSTRIPVASHAVRPS